MAPRKHAEDQDDAGRLVVEEPGTDRLAPHPWDRRFVAGVLFISVAVATSIDRTDYLSASDRWIAAGLAVATLLVAERLLRLPSASVVLGYCVIGLSPDLVLGWVQVAPAEIVAAVLVILILLRVRKVSVGRDTLRALRVPGIAWAVFGGALCAGTIVATLSSPPLTTSAIGELLRWWFAPAVGLAVLISQPRWRTGVTVGLLAAAVAHALLIFYQSMTFDSSFRERPFGLLSSGSSLAGEIVANPNAAGVALAMVTIFAIGMSADLASRSTRGERRAAMVVGAAACLCSVASIVTLSRSAWLFLLVGCFLVVIRTRAKWVLVLPVAVAALVLMLPMTQGRLLRTISGSSAPEFSGSVHHDRRTGQSIERLAISNRFDAWELALIEGADRGPIVGLGPQALQRLAGTPADNSYLEGFVDAGAPGAVALLVLAFSAPFAIVRMRGTAGAVGVTGAFAIVGALGNYWFDPRLLFLWMMLVGLSVAGEHGLHRESKRGKRAETTPGSTGSRSQAPSPEDVP